jgi:predicted  nucleic acid-binding Zn-ribbon protein
VIQLEDFYKGLGLMVGFLSHAGVVKYELRRQTASLVKHIDSQGQRLGNMENGFADIKKDVIIIKEDVDKLSNRVTVLEQKEIKYEFKSNSSIPGSL